MIALGAHLDMEAIPGLAGSAETFYTMPGAARLSGILKTFAGGEVAVLVPRKPFMCPPGPYEDALVLQAFFEEHGLAGKAHLSVYTIEEVPMATAGPEAGRFVIAQLEKRGIAFHGGVQVERVDGARKRIVFAGGSEAPYDLLIAVPPHEAPRVVREGALAGPKGWIPIDPQTMEVAHSPTPGRIFAVGDVTTVPLPGRFVPEAPLVLPMAGIFAEKEARVVACRIAAHVQQQKTEDVFDGEGFCYIEVDRKLAVRGDGHFFERPHPSMSFQEPTEEMVAHKKAWVKDWMEKYL